MADTARGSIVQFFGRKQDHRSSGKLYPQKAVKVHSLMVGSYLLCHTKASMADGQEVANFDANNAAMVCNNAACSHKACNYIEANNTLAQNMDLYLVSIEDRFVFQRNDCLVRKAYLRS